MGIIGHMFKIKHFVVNVIKYYINNRVTAYLFDNIQKAVEG